jgi:hypothetical protein
MNEQQLFEIAAKLHNLRPDQLRLKRRYLDVIVIETMDGTKHTYFIADLEDMVAEQAATERALGEEAQAATAPAAKPTHTRKR